MSKYNTARKAWFYAYYNSGNSALIETLQLEQNIQKTHINNSIEVCIDQWLRGKVQSAIASLPEALQSFGNVLYKPEFTNEEVEQAHGSIKIGLFEKYSGQIWTDEKLNKVHYLIFAAMREYKSLVNNQKNYFQSHNELCTYLAEWYGITILRNNWHRDWNEVYQKTLDVCNELDIKALKPVSNAVRSINKLEAA